MKPNRSDRDREEWIINDEGLYRWWKGSRMSMRSFIRSNRREIDEAIDRQLGGRRDNPVSAYYHGRMTEVGPRFSFIPNAEWTTEYINDLPDSAFLIVRKREVEYVDEKGRSHPLSSRSLPVKNHLGNYSCPHLRNAEARANQVKGVSRAEQMRAKKKASDLYDRYCRG